MEVRVNDGRGALSVTPRRENLFELTQERGDGHFLLDDGAQRVDRHTFLLHRVAVTDRHAVVRERLVVDRDTISVPMASCRR